VWEKKQVKRSSAQGCTEAAEINLSEKQQNRPAPPDFYYSYGSSSNKQLTEWEVTEDIHKVGLVAVQIETDSPDETKKKEAKWEEQFWGLMDKFPQLTVYMHYKGKVEGPNLNQRKRVKMTKGLSSAQSAALRDRNPSQNLVLSDGLVDVSVLSKPSWDEMVEELSEADPVLLSRAIPKPPPEGQPIVRVEHSTGAV